MGQATQLKDAHTTSIHGKSLATLLPDEVLEIIFDFLWTESSRNSFCNAESVLYRLTLVCKKWTPCATTRLYTAITLRHDLSDMLLYRSLTSSQHLGRNVRQLDIHDIIDMLSPRHPKCLIQILDVLPRLSHIAIDLQHCEMLYKYPFWQKITHLKLSRKYHERDKTASMVSKHFPPQMRVLTLDGVACMINPLHVNNWSTLEFPCLQTLVLEGPFGSPLYDTLPPPGKPRLLPIVPALTRINLNIYWPTYDDGWDPYPGVLIILTESAHSLSHLELIGVREKDDILASIPWSLMDQLQVLAFSGCIELSHELQTLRKLPQSLKRLSISWSGPASFGVSLLFILLDVTFLPKLLECPRISWTSTWTSRHAEIVTEDEKVCLIERAYDFLEMFNILRPDVPIPINPCSLRGNVRNDLPLVPLPFEYQNSLRQASSAVQIAARELGL